ncbi:MAG: hypothetical protein M0R37_13885 [Bacteroidales bacterium]|nr:hypothetical protein [Bacteroidales bacterium]
MSEPTVKELIDRVEAAEARAASAEALAAAAVKAGGAGDTVTRVEAKLVPQEELSRRYEEKRRQFQDIMRTSMTDRRFRAEARGDTPGDGLPSSDALRQIVREELARLIAEETASTKPAKDAHRK